MNENLQKEVLDDGICILSINRKPVNALSYDFLKEIKNSFLEIENDVNIRVVILKSNLEHFCAGADLKERKIMSKNDAGKALDNFNDCFNLIERLTIPTICLINGYCLGGGAELALAFDFRLGLSDCVIGFPEVSIGIIPGAGGTYRLPKLIGLSNAKHWIYTAEKFDVDDALRYGFLNLKVEMQDGLDVALKLCNKIISNAPIAIKSAKKSINDAFNKELNAGLMIERKNYELTLNTNDRDEALDAFINKRKPIWKNE